MFEEEKSDVHEFISGAEQYLNTRQELTQLKITEKMVVVYSSLAATVVLIVICFVGFIFISIGAAIMIAKHFDSYATGFIMVATFYFLVALILLIMKNKWLETPMMNRMIKVIFKQRNNEQN